MRRCRSQSFQNIWEVLLRELASSMDAGPRSLWLTYWVLTRLLSCGEYRYFDYYMYQLMLGLQYHGHYDLVPWDVHHLVLLRRQLRQPCCARGAILVRLLVVSRFDCLWLEIWNLISTAGHWRRVCFEKPPTVLPQIDIQSFRPSQLEPGFTVRLPSSLSPHLVFIWCSSHMFVLGTVYCRIYRTAVSSQLFPIHDFAYRDSVQKVFYRENLPL